jgi:hypothetical protein
MVGAAAMAWAPDAEAQLYSETFPKVGAGDAPLADIGWDDTSTGGATALFDHTGSGVSNEAATPDGVDAGAAFVYRNTNGTRAMWTTEFTPITPGASGVDIIWYQTEDALIAGSTVDVRAAVMVGGQWYASDRAFTTGDATSPWQRIVLPYAQTAANWRLLTMNAGSATIGETPGANLSGAISGLALVTEMTNATIGNESVWFDYIEIANHLAQGDVNGVGGVTIDDYNIIRSNYRTNVTSRAQGDLNADGFVDVFDFREWKANFPGASDALGLTIPEPGSCSIALVGAALAWMQRRQRAMQCRNGRSTRE